MKSLNVLKGESARTTMPTSSALICRIGVMSVSALYVVFCISCRRSTAECITAIW